MNILVNLGLKWVEIFEVKIPDNSFIVVPRPPPFLNPHMHVSYRMLCIYICIFYLYIYICLQNGFGFRVECLYVLHHVTPFALRTVLTMKAVLQLSCKSTILNLWKQVRNARWAFVEPTFQYFFLWFECSRLFNFYSPISWSAEVFWCSTAQLGVMYCKFNSCILQQIIREGEWS